MLDWRKANAADGCDGARASTQMCSMACLWQCSAGARETILPEAEIWESFLVVFSFIYRQCLGKQWKIIPYWPNLNAFLEEKANKTQQLSNQLSENKLLFYLWLPMLSLPDQSFLTAYIFALSFNVREQKMENLHAHILKSLNKHCLFVCVRRDCNPNQPIINTILPLKLFWAWNFLTWGKF